MRKDVHIECAYCQDHIEDEYIYEFDNDFYHEDCLEEVVKQKQIEEGEYDPEISVMDDKRIIRWSWWV